MADKYTVANPFYNGACTQTSAPPHTRPFGGDTSCGFDKTLGTHTATEAVYMYMPVGSHRYYVLERRGACAGEFGDVDNGGGRAVKLQAEYWNGSAWEVLGWAWLVHLENVQVAPNNYYSGTVLVGYTKKSPTGCADGQHLHLELTAAGARTAILYTGNPAAYGDVGSL